MNKVFGSALLLFLYFYLSEQKLEKPLILFCNCGESVKCFSSNIFKYEVNQRTDIVLKGCEDLTKTSVEEIHLSWLREGINKQLNSFPNLKTLRITSSILKTFNSSLTSGLMQVEALRLNGNEIEEIAEFPRLPVLKKLFLSDNKINILRRKTFRNIKMLKLLTFENNNIFYIHGEAFGKNHELHELNLNRNQLSFLEPSSFNKNMKLKEISMNYNSIKFLPTEIFQNNVDLETLRLHGNNLKSLQRNIFMNNFNLRWIELGENQLTFIHSNVFEKLQKLEFVDFSFNDCIDDTFPIGMNFENFDRLIERNCHFLAAKYFGFEE